MTNILMILTGARIWNLKDGTKRPTGFWAEEFVEPHRIFTEAGVNITIATPGGVTPIVDEVSLDPGSNGGDLARVEQLRSYLAKSRDALAASVPVADVDPADYDAVFIPGGHGPMEDLAVDKDVASVLTTLLHDQSKVVSSVCHGPASFLSAIDDKGKWLFEGRTLTAFLDEEEAQVGLADNAPWLLEARLRSTGAKFDAGDAWASHIVVDGNLVTGQNPQSAEAAAHTVLEQIAARV
jgi:putative intracellular protease/amidase